MDFDMISKSKVDELKSFLRLRNLKVSSSKNELISRVFVAVENNVHVVPTAVEIEENLAVSYDKKLVFDDIRIPDPFKIVHGWQDEDDGMAFWSIVISMDTCTKLMFFPSELKSSDLSDYKVCKAYSYFKNGWLHPLFYHNLSGSKYCLIKGECMPSQNNNDPLHKLWIIFLKSGKIMTCHCTCKTGMSQVCNHIAHALYRMESGVRNGLTNPACTS